MSEDIKAQALADYRNPSLKLTEIAKKYEIPLWTLNYWIRRDGGPRRTRGSRPLTEPSARAREILAYAGTHGFSKAATYFNVSKQCVSSLAKRWNIPSPKRSSVARPEPGSQVKSKQRVRKPARDVVVSFRLRKDESSSLQAMRPLGATKRPGSLHKLVRAIVLERLENAHALEFPNASKVV